MTFASRQKHLRIYAAVIVAHQYAQLPGSVFQLDFDALRARMPEGVDQSFPADAVDLVTQNRMQWARLAVQDYAKSDVFLDSQLLLDARKCLSQIQIAAVAGAQPLYRIAAFFDYLVHQLQDPPQRGLGGRIRRKAIGCHVQLHGCAEEALQQGVMQFLRDARPFREPLFKTNVELPGEIVQPQAIKSRDHQGASQHQAGAEPRGLPKHRVDLQSNAGFRAIPNAVRVARDHTEAIGARCKVGVVGFAICHRLARAMIEALQGVSESNAPGNRKAYTGIAKSDPLPCRWNPNRTLQGNLAPIRRYRLNVNDGRSGGGCDARRIHHGKTSVQRKPDVSKRICHHRAMTFDAFHALQPVRQTIFADVSVAQRAAQQFG